MGGISGLKVVDKRRKVRRLTAPLNFLCVSHPEKRKYDLWYPLGIGIAVAIGYHLLPIRPSLFGPNGLLQDFQVLLGLLFPFFVAALAAVATFQREGLDEVTAGRTPMKLGRKSLTRRELVSYMFGYLAFLSLALFLSNIALKVFAPSIVLYAGHYVALVRGIGILILAIAYANLFVTTLWGLFYLTDRLNRD